MGILSHDLSPVVLQRQIQEVEFVSLMAKYDGLQRQVWERLKKKNSYRVVHLAEMDEGVNQCTYSNSV